MTTLAHLAHLSREQHLVSARYSATEVRGTTRDGVAETPAVATLTR